jgi:hypothetical protein
MPAGQNAFIDALDHRSNFTRAIDDIAGRYNRIPNQPQLERMPSMSHLDGTFWRREEDMPDPNMPIQETDRHPGRSFYTPEYLRDHPPVPPPPMDLRALMDRWKQQQSPPVQP